MNNPIAEFMENSLVKWVRTFENDGGGGLTYGALADGVFLYDVMTHIAPPSGLVEICRNLNRCPEDLHSRLSNLSSLISLIRSFYQDVLGQLLLTSLPDVLKLSRDPISEEGTEELRKLILLILGCAVQSPALKEDVIGRIQALPIELQHDLARYIQEVTDNVECVWPSEWNQLDCIPVDAAPKVFTLMLSNCRRLVGERDLYWQELIKCLLGEDDGEQNSQENVHHLGVELAEIKAQLRRLRQEYDEKLEQNVELKEELEQTKDNISKLRQENIDLVQDARSARAWRDEADILRERAVRVDALESEVSRYKDKMADIEFYKTRVDELREDNRILSETKEMLEEQLLSSRRKAEQVLDLENTILQLKQTINHLHLERDADHNKIQDIMEENAQLQLLNKNSLSESATLAAQMESLRSKNAGFGGRNLGSDIAGDAQTRVLKLELENQRLEAELSELRGQTLLASSDKILELEKENRRLSLKVTNLQEQSKKETAQALETQQKLQVKERENTRLQDAISTVRENGERQTAELEKEATHLQELIETLRERQKKTTDDRLLDVEKENKDITDVNLKLQNQITRLEHEKQQLNRLTERLRESAEKLSEVEHQKAEIERENKDLVMALNTFKESCARHEKLEHDYSSLEVEYNKVSRTLENTKETLAKMENAQSDKLQLQVEVERLTRSLATFKASSSKMADLEMEKDQLLQQTNTLQKDVTALRVEKARADQLELDVMSYNTEVQKLKRTVDASQRKLQDMEKDKGEIETENVKLLRNVETLKLSTRKLNEVERDLTDLEGINDRLDRENKSLKKEVERLKNSIEVKDNLVEESSAKACKIERENRKLTKEVEGLRANDNRVKTLEHERREIDQQTVVERRTLNTLREDLVAEKVKTQQLTNQLDSLTADLSKLGLNAANLSSPASDAMDDRYKALEGMMEETLKRSIEVRQEKIDSLQSRLTESVARNQQLRNQLLQVRSDYECLLQRHQEENSDLSVDATKELSKIKDSLRKSTEEKTSLENEISVLSSQRSSYKEQVCALQSQVTSLSTQNTVISKHNATLQGENARLQVENTTLQSQSASIIAQNSTLQTSATQLESERDKVKRSYDERGTRLNQLINDHESLQKLHRQLTQEYEDLTSEQNTLKTSYKNLKIEAKLLKDRQTNLSNNEDELIRLRESLEEEMTNLKKDSNSLSNLRAEHSRLKEDFRSLFSANERLRSEYKVLQMDYKSIKTENNTMKLKCTEFSGELNEVRDQMSAMDIEASKLTNKCQVLQKMNVTLEEDRRSLMSQVSLLLTQYHDLLTQTLEDKQHFHQEEKNFTDKLNNLRRQKEKLEEKIMEQYRKMDSSPHKKKGFGSNLVKRVRKAGTDLMSKVPRSARSRSRGRDEMEEENQDSSSMSSSSQANDSSLDSGSETRRSSPNLLLHSISPSSPTNGNIDPNHDSVLTKSLSELILPSLRDSLSSEDMGSPTDLTESSFKDDPRTKEEVTSGELNKAGSRKPLCVTATDGGGGNGGGNNCSPNDVSEVLRDQMRGRSSTRSLSSISLNHSRNPLLNGSSLSNISNLNRSNNNNSAPVGPRSSTPLSSNVNTPIRERILESPKSTPKLPPRMDHSIHSAPQIPPRRKGSLHTTSDSSMPSSQSNSLNGTPELRKRPPPPPPPQDLPQKPPPTTKDGVDNSVWYEYGCV